MSGTFTNRKKLIMLSGAVAEKMPYIKNADSLFSDAEMRGKKFGMKVSGYLADSGSVNDGLKANPDKIHEVEIFAWMKNKNTSVEVDLWDEFTNIEDFKREITDKRSGKLARECQLEILRENVYRSAQAIVSGTAGFGVLSDSSSALDELAVDGDLVTFLRPTLHGKIAEGGLSRFIPSEQMKDIYSENYLGQYANSAQVELAGMPVWDSTGVDEAPTISAEVVKDASNNIIGLKPISTITGSGTGTVKVGTPYKLEGLKVVDESGIETEQDFTIIVNEEKQYDADGNETTVTYIPQIRVTVPGAAYGNPNAVLDAATISAALSGDTATFTLSLLDGITVGKKYNIGQTRTIKALSFDQYRFSTLPAAKTEDVGTFENITLKAQMGNNLLNGTNLVRIDMPFCSKLFEIRKSVTIYIEK